MASTQSVILRSGDLHTSWLGSVGEEIRIPINARNDPNGKTKTKPPWRAFFSPLKCFDYSKWA